MTQFRRLEEEHREKSKSIIKRQLQAGECAVESFFDTHTHTHTHTEPPHSLIRFVGVRILHAYLFSVDPDKKFSDNQLENAIDDESFSVSFQLLVVIAALKQWTLWFQIVTVQDHRRLLLDEVEARKKEMQELEQNIQVGVACSQCTSNSLPSQSACRLLSGHRAVIVHTIKCQALLLRHCHLRLT